VAVDVTPKTAATFGGALEIASTSAGMSSGGVCRSASNDTMNSPRASRRPACVAPKRP